MTLYKIAIILAHTPVDLPIQDARLTHPEVVFLAIKCIKKVVLPCCDVPLPLQESRVNFESTATLDKSFHQMQELIISSIKV